MTDPALIHRNIAELRRRIRLAEQESGRDANSVTLMAVSKTRPAEAIREVLAAGITHIGENYIQEALSKQALLNSSDNSSDNNPNNNPNLHWHCIGPIQSNKSRALAEHFDWVHTVDRDKIARRLSAQRPLNLPPLNICLQVNIDEEPQKAGIASADLAALADTVARLPGLNLRGVMAIPAARQNYREQRQVFARLRQCFESLQQRHPQLDTLSMGMSQDFEAAIAEGATLIRIGSAIFGPRDAGS